MNNNWEIDGVTKKFDNVTAIDDISLEIEKNKIYGLIGRNGAGKTTLLKLLANQLIADAGTIKNGNEILKNNDSLTQSICLARETININGVEKFTAKRIFDFASYIYPNWDNNYCLELSEQFELDLNKKYIKLSKGMHTVVGIILGLASRAPLTLFDEPYVGLDPVAREIFYELLLNDFQENKRTIIISSQLINELENLFDRVLIVKNGRLVLNEGMEEIHEMTKVVSGGKGEVKKVLKDKRVIHKQLIGRLANYTVLDRFTERELQSFKDLDISYSSINLQKLFVNLS